MEILCGPSLHFLSFSGHYSLPISTETPVVSKQDGNDVSNSTATKMGDGA
jgi:hypothetical protein